MILSLRQLRPLSRSVLLLTVALLVTGCATTKTTTTASPSARPLALRHGQRMIVRTTAYTHTEPGGRSNAIGTRLRFGGDSYSAASDWSWMPLGTRFKMLCNGRNYIVEDYGSALVGRKTVDLYMPTRAMMNAWGLRNVEIEILEWGSRPMSLKLLTPRQHNRHVAVMCAELRRQKVKIEG